MVNTYQVDTLIRLTGAFTLADNVTPADPTTVTIWMQAPDGTVQSTASVVRDGVGLYHYDFTVTEIGPYIYKWQGQGALEITSPDTYFNVAPTVFSPSP